MIIGDIKFDCKNRMVGVGEPGSSMCESLESLENFDIMLAFTQTYRA